MSEYIRDDADEELDYFTIMPYSAGEPYVSRIYAYGYHVEMMDGTVYASDMWYSIDGGEWTLVNKEGYIDVPCFSKIRFKGNWHEMMKDVESEYENIKTSYSASFVSEGGYDWWLLEGTPLSLLHGDNFKERKNDWNPGWDSFYKMFNNNNDVGQINNPKTFLPSTELCDWCYDSMFYNSSICNAPELPAETLKEGCYYSMFFGCYNLKEAPALNAKTLVPECYGYMFYDCIYLNYVKITATDGFDAKDAAYQMFYNCPEYGLGVLSQELIDADFGSSFLPKWAIISEDYPTNDKGYPETKGNIYDYTIALCFNADFQERYYDGLTQFYSNYYESDSNEAGRQFYEDFIEKSGITIGSSVSINYSGIFFNRQSVESVYYGEYEGEEYLLFNLTSRYQYPDYAVLYPDGSFYIGEQSDLIYDYIKK